MAIVEIHLLWRKSVREHSKAYEFLSCGIDNNNFHANDLWPNGKMGREDKRVIPKLDVLSLTVTLSQSEYSIYPKSIAIALYIEMSH